MTELEDNSSAYYALDLPGLSKTGAEATLNWVKSQSLAKAGWIVEPGDFYSVHLDICSVRMLRDAARIALDSRQISSHDVDGLSALLEDFDRWLEQAGASHRPACGPVSSPDQ